MTRNDARLYHCQFPEVYMQFDWSVLGSKEIGDCKYFFYLLSTRSNCVAACWPQSLHTCPSTPAHLSYVLFQFFLYFTAVLSCPSNMVIAAIVSAVFGQKTDSGVYCPPAPAPTTSCTVMNLHRMNESLIDELAIHANR
jgi:hypothetical protein